MSNSTLRDDQWEKIYLFLKNHPRVYAGGEEDCRLFVDGVLWITRSGAQWRFLPDKYGNWNTIYKRFARWCDHDVWDDMHQHFVSDPDMENILLDSTVVRAHPCAAGAQKKAAAKPHRLSGVAEADSAPKSTPV
jgi:transposase